MPARRAASRLIQAQAQHPPTQTQPTSTPLQFQHQQQRASPSSASASAASTNGTHSHARPSSRPRTGTLTLMEWTLPCQYCSNPCPSSLPCCPAWRNHTDYVQLWRALDGIRAHYRRGSRRRTAIDMWMEVDEFDREAGPERAEVEAEREEAVDAWGVLEEMREELEEEHPVVKAMDRWLMSAEADPDGDGEGEGEGEGV